MKNRAVWKLFVAFCVISLSIHLIAYPAYADIKKAALSTKPIKVINALNKRDNTFPVNLSTDKEVYVVIFASSTVSDVYVLARSSVDLEYLARKLETAVSGTILGSEPVMYMKGKGYSWADAYVERPQLWANKAEMRHQVGLILSRLSQDGFKTNTILCILKTTKPSDVLHLKGYTNKKWSFFRIDPNRSDLDFTLRAELSRVDIIKGSIMQILIPVICILAIPILIYITRRKRDTIIGRRSLYSNSFFYLMILLNAVSMTFATTQIRSPWRYKLEDVWFGIGGGVLWFAFPFLIPIMFSFTRGLTARLAFPGVIPESLHVKPWYKMHSWWGIFIFFCYFISMAVFASTLPDDALLARKTSIVSLLVFFLLEHIYSQIKRRFIKAHGTRTYSDELTKRYSVMAQEFNLSVKKCFIVTAKENYKQRAPIIFRNNSNLLIDNELVDTLTPEELDFIVASEYTHQATQYRQKTAFVLYGGTILILIPGTLFITQPLYLSVFNWQIWAMAAGTALLIYNSILSGKRMEDADKLALRHTRNTKAAVDAVIKTFDLLIEWKNSMNNYKNGYLSHYNPKRLIALRKAAEEMDLGIESAFGKTEQDDYLTNRAQSIAEKMGVRFSKIDVLDLPDGKQLVNAGVFRDGKIIVGRSLLDKFNHEEVDFVLAHELAHIKSKHIIKMIINIIASMILIAASTLIMFTGKFELMSYGVWSGLIGSALFVGNITWLSRRRELYADKIALRVTGNLPVAISVIKKLTENNPIDIPEELEGYRTHPKDSFRIQSLQKSAKRMGVADA